MSAVSGHQLAGLGSNSPSRGHSARAAAWREFASVRTFQAPAVPTMMIIAMIIMFKFSGNISAFIHRHPTLKMLALSFLLMVGFSLFFEGLEPVHGSHIDKGYIYFAMAFSFGVELLNLWMRKKEKERKPIELREPVLKGSQVINYDDQAH